MFKVNNKDTRMTPIVNFKQVRVELGQVYCLLQVRITARKSVQIRNFIWSLFFHIWTEYEDLRINNNNNNGDDDDDDDKNNNDNYSVNPPYLQEGFN